MAPRETENNASAKFWDDKQRVLWYVMVFSGVVNCVGPQLAQAQCVSLIVYNTCSFILRNLKWPDSMS